MPSWDPQQYGRFSDHRLRPGLDLLARIGDLPEGPVYDLGCGAGALSLLFANASLQWLDGHDALFARLMGLLPPGGVLAVQMPRNHESPSHRLMREAAEAGPWRSRLQQ